jgi:membrane associated rhomboid family serine protease
MQPAKNRIFNAPPVVLASVALFVAIEAIAQSLPPQTYLEFLRTFAFVPGRVTFGFDPDRIVAELNRIAALSGTDVSAERYFLGDGDLQWWTFLTYALLHGGWLHVAVNSLWFAAFGSAVARRFGTPRFLVFCAVTALAGAGMHFLTHMDDLRPMVGASAVVSGAMAAAVRFVFQPGAPLGESLGRAMHADEALMYRQPALPLPEIATNPTAISFLAFWFLANFFFAAMPLPLDVEDTAIAWEAHIGGFLVGLLAFRWFDPPVPPPDISRLDQFLNRYDPFR